MPNPDLSEFYGAGVDSARAGDYGCVLIDGEWAWRCRTPNGLGGLLSQHEVVEHEDGTISVSPSILVNWPNRSEPQRWHGYLERGVWREV